ncbi:MAG: tripartite tricarboxylate transporter substrate-binding protein, partial [Rubrivivax sp.]|nr:tripartite tricarboxylate transporter substrate-binding protein [Rubrivivax sp.]
MFKTSKLMAAFAVAAVASSTVATAQDWPKAKPITFTVAFGAGSSTDIIARVVGQKVSESLGQTVVIDNKPGAGGSIGAQLVKRAAPDGYHLLVISVSYAVNPSLYANAGYDPLLDFMPVALGPSTPNIITVHPSVPVNNIQELIALAKSKPGELNYGSTGIGSGSHLSTELFMARTGTKMTQVPYRGAPPLV